jgi:hypothetical protein
VISLKLFGCTKLQRGCQPKKPFSFWDRDSYTSQGWVRQLLSRNFFQPETNDEGLKVTPQFATVETGLGPSNHGSIPGKGDSVVQQEG